MQTNVSTPPPDPKTRCIELPEAEALNLRRSHHLADFGEGGRGLAAFDRLRRRAPQPGIRMLRPHEHRSLRRLVAAGTVETIELPCGGIDHGGGGPVPEDEVAPGHLREVALLGGGGGGRRHRGDPRITNPQKVQNLEEGEQHEILRSHRFH